MIHFHANLFRGTTAEGLQFTRNFVINEQGLSIPGAITALPEIDQLRVFIFAPVMQVAEETKKAGVTVRDSVQSAKHIARVLHLSNADCGYFSSELNTDNLACMEM